MTGLQRSIRPQCFQELNHLEMYFKGVIWDFFFLFVTRLCEAFLLIQTFKSLKTHTYTHAHTGLRQRLKSKAMKISEMFHASYFFKKVGSKPLWYLKVIISIYQKKKKNADAVLLKNQ